MLTLPIRISKLPTYLFPSFSNILGMFSLEVKWSSLPTTQVELSSNDWILYLRWNEYFFSTDIFITFFIFTVFIVRMFILFCSRFVYLSAHGATIRDRARFLFSFFEDEEASVGLIRQDRSTLPGAGSTDMEQLYLRKNYQNSCSFNRFIQLKINYWLLWIWMEFN